MPKGPPKKAAPAKKKRPSALPITSMLLDNSAPDRLAKHWGLDLDGFVAACRTLKGTRLEIGDAGFSLPVLPRIDMAAIYWLGDEDFSSRASILFDANSHHYMFTDGLAILGSQLVSRILSSGARHEGDI